MQRKISEVRRECGQVAHRGVKLTDEQKTAVRCDDEDVMLTACPGSGKTRVIVSKLSRAIEAVRGMPRAVACITYTNAAVYEIEARLRHRIQPGDELYFDICTIHSFCLNHIFRPFCHLVTGFAGTMRVLTQDRPEFEAIARYAAEQVNFFNLGARDLEAFASLGLDAKGHLIGLALTNEAVRRAAPHFWRRCTELEFIDFGNIVYKAYCLIRDNPMVAQSVASPRRRSQSRCRRGRRIQAPRATRVQAEGLAQAAVFLAGHSTEPQRSL